MFETAETGNATLYRGDCLEVMKTLPDQSIDLILCDLPYGTTQNDWDSVIDQASMWREYRRLAKGGIVLTATQPFASELIASAKDLFRYDLIWAKNKASGHLNAKRCPMRAHESILVFLNGSSVYNPQKSEGHAPSNYAKRTTHTSNYGSQVSTTYEGGKTDRYPTSVLHFPVLNNDSPERFHPTQKPAALMEYLINTYSNPGDVVLDNTMGSGTTGVAAMNTGRRFIGIEREPDYFAIACARVAPGHEQPDTLPMPQAEPRAAVKPQAQPDLFSFSAALGAA